MSADITAGGTYLWRGKEVTVTGIEGDRAVVTSPSLKSVRLVKLGELMPIIEPGFEDVEALTFDQEDWDRAVRLRDELIAIDELKSGKSAAVEAAAERLDLSARQVWRLLKTFQANPEVTALLAAKCGRPVDFRALGERQEQLIRQCIDTVYLQAEKPSAASTFDALEAACIKEGIDCPAIGTLRSRIKSVALRTRLSARVGKKRANEVCEGVPEHVDVKHVLERVEIDHTRVDIILRADTPGRELVGRPWLTLAIDVKSRMILGFHLSFETPSAAAVAVCLAMAALPKDEMLKALGIVGNWPCHGIPRMIMVDNALEFRSHAMRRGCKQHLIKLLFRPVGSPRYGGTIERLNGTMMGMVHILPGTTQNGIEAKGDYDAERKATMTLSEFIPWFVEQIVTQYHLTPHSTIRLTPLQQWQKDEGETEIRKVRDRLEYYASFLPGERRLLTRTGVRLKNVSFWSDRFKPWVGEDKQVLVHYHPMDAGLAYVRMPDGTIAVAEADRPDASGKTFSDLRAGDMADHATGRDKTIQLARVQGFQANELRLKESILKTAQAKPEKLAETAPVNARAVAPIWNFEAPQYQNYEVSCDERRAY